MQTLPVFKSQSGFTLIELSVVLFIIGILLGAFLPALGLWVRHQRIDVTKQHMSEIREALARYYDRNSLYPCPGPRIDLQSDYQHTDSCAADDASMRARGVYFMTGTAPQKPAVEGGVPYKKLNIAKDTIFDGWGNLITYAVTANLTNPTTFDAKGGIGLTDRNGHSVIDPPGSALWLLLSSGEDGKGGYAGGGQPSPCDNGQLDGRNCAHSGVYVAEDIANARGPGHFDDVLMFRTWVEYPIKGTPSFCRAENRIDGSPTTGSAAMVADGTIVKTCDSAGKCQWMICHNGSLVPDLIDMQRFLYDISR